MNELIKPNEDSWKGKVYLVRPAVLYSPKGEEIPLGNNLHYTHFSLGHLDEELQPFTVEDLAGFLKPLPLSEKISIATVNGHDLFGPDKNIPALKINGDSLGHEYSDALGLLFQNGCKVTLWWDFNPHITVDPVLFQEMDEFPSTALLLPPQLWYDDQVIPI